MNKIRRKALREILTKLEELESLRSEIVEQLAEPGQGKERGRHAGI